MTILVVQPVHYSTYYLSAENNIASTEVTLVLQRSFSAADLEAIPQGPMGDIPPEMQLGMQIIGIRCACSVNYDRADFRIGDFE